MTTRELAREVHRLLAERRTTVAVAESLTGGLLAATLTDIPGASATFRGAIVAYATDLKATLLGVPESSLSAYGPVHPDVAKAMAAGARDRLCATYGIGTTGVAGPDTQGGQPVGTVYVAVAAPDGVAQVRRPRVSGDRAAIRLATVEHALRLLRQLLVREHGA